MAIRGDRLKSLIQKRGIKQSWLAAEVGIPAETLSRLITGTLTNTRLETISRLAEALEVSIDWLAGRPAPDPTPYDTRPEIRSMVDRLETVDPRTQELILRAFEWILTGAGANEIDVRDYIVTEDEDGKDDRPALPPGIARPEGPPPTTAPMSRQRKRRKRDL